MREVWQSMETAPKDGTEILLVVRNDVVTLGHWLDNSKTKWPWEGWSTQKGPFAERFVYHWMPLPSPPRKDEAVNA